MVGAVDQFRADNTGTVVEVELEIVRLMQMAQRFADRRRNLAGR